MSQYATSAVSSPNTNGHLEGSQNEEHNENEDTKSKRHRSKQDTWKGIFVITQFWVVAIAAVAFLFVVTLTVNKTIHSQTLETKDRVYQQNTWFKFAICLRPFMTDDTMREMYNVKLNKSLEDHIMSMTKLSNEEKSFFRRKFYLDHILEPENFESYIKKLHPWETISPSVLWEIQKTTIQESFKEFLVNGISVGTSQNENKEEDEGMLRKNKGNKGTIREYVTLPSKTENATEGKPPLLVGEYLLSPVYLGCLSITVNKKMASKQIEISVNFNPTKTANLKGKYKKEQNLRTALFKGADIFVFNKNDTFTEIPTITQTAKFSMLAESRERLLVLGSRFVRQKTMKRRCATNETYSEIDCRQDCIYKHLLSEINCTLPWMKRISPKQAANYTNKMECSDLDASHFMKTVEIQGHYLKNGDVAKKELVQQCLDNCLESCKSFSVRILSLGSKSIGSNYGVTLTFSPAIDEVKEHYTYNYNNAMSELCASISFLLGVSAIGIYDWLVTFGVWVSIRLGLHEPDDEEEEEEKEKEEEEVAPSAAARRDSMAAAAAQPGVEGGPGERRVSVTLHADRLMLPGDTAG